MNDSSTGSERSLYLYVLVLGNLIATMGMALLLLGTLGALGLINTVTSGFGGFGSGFASATTGSAVQYSFAFLSSLLALAASWKMFREGARLWLLVLAVAFQALTAVVFHSLVSVIVLIPAAAALYGLALQLRPALIGPVSISPSTSAPGATPPPAPGAIAGSAAIVTSAPLREATVPDPPPAPPSRRCANCGAPNSEGARFCISCGSILPG